MRRFFIIGLFLLSNQLLTAQNSSDCKNIPYFRTLNTEKLALRITRNLESDSAKVYAIHCWITHHIRYDVHKYLKYDYSSVPLKKILRSRKAICTGYSELFNELCHHAGLISVSVPGYTNTPNTDLNDKYYLDEHIWNAVYINQEWKLIDACWDAGYISNFRRTFFGHFVYFFSFGHSEIVKYKPHFIRSPNLFYFYRNGIFFQTDHISANPAWQLMNPIKTILQFESDSSFYLGKYTLTNDFYQDDSMENERAKLILLEGDDRFIAENRAVYNFNYKNQYSAGNSCYLFARKLFNNIDFSSTDILSIWIQLNLVEKIIEKAQRHYDSNEYFLNMQKNELNANNALKLKIIRTQNKHLINSTRNVINKLHSVKNRTNSAKKKCLFLMEYGNISRLALIQSNKFKKTDFTTNNNSNDSIKISLRIKALQQTAAELENSISARFIFLDSLENAMKERFNKYSSASNSNYLTSSELCILRMDGIDDLDFIMRKIKDTLLNHKFKEDSFLFDTVGGFIVSYYYNEFSKLKPDFRNLYKCRKYIANEYCRLKKVSYFNKILECRYQENINAYRNEVRSHNQKLEKYRWKFTIFQIESALLIKVAKKEMEFYYHEKNIENYQYISRAKYIIKHYHSLLNVSYLQKRNCINLKNQLLIQKKLKFKAIQTVK